MFESYDIGLEKRSVCIIREKDHDTRWTMSAEKVDKINANDSRDQMADEENSGCARLYFITSLYGGRNRYDHVPGSSEGHFVLN